MDSPVGKKLTGLVAATFTPLTPQGEINLPVIGLYIDYLLEHQGVRNVFVNGTTGEGMSLTVEERKKLAEEWCGKGKGRLEQVIIHVGCMSLKDSQDLARHAARAGADGIAVVSPSVFKPSDAGVLRQFLQEVAAAAPDLAFYYYHIPALTGVNLLARDVLEGIEKQIPSFRGLKFSGSDLMDFGQCVSYCPSDWSILYGMDEFEVQDGISYAVKLGFDVAVNKSLMSEVSGLDLGPRACPSGPAPSPGPSPSRRDSERAPRPGPSPVRTRTGETQTSTPGTSCKNQSLRFLKMSDLREL